MKKQRLLAVCCAMLMAATAASCGNGTNGTSETGKTGDTGSKPSSSTSTQSSEASANEGSSDSNLPLQELTLPLTEEPVTLTIWKSWANDYTPDLNKYAIIDEIEEKTGVRLEFTTVASSAATEKYGMLLSSGDLPDLIMHNNISGYPGGGEKAIVDGIYVDMTDLVENYMPNYRALRLIDETTRKMTVTDNGKMWGIFMLRSTDNMEVVPEPAWCGLVIRKDWVDDLGIDMPVTIDDWHEVLTAFKNEKGCEAPLMVGNDGVPTYDYFLSAYGVTSDFYNDNGTVKFGPIEEGYRQYLEMASQWYAEGLIDPNFISNNVGSNTPVDYIATGKAGAGTLSWAATADTYVQDGRATDENLYLAAVKGPVLHEGEATQARCTSYAVQVATAMTTSCKHPEIAAMWMDYMYTRDGMQWNSYGDESCYTYENGQYAYTDVIMNGSNGLSGQSEQFCHIFGDNVGMVSWQRFDLLNPAERLEARNVYESDGTSLIIPQIEMTDEEGREYNSLYTDIQTMVQEKTAAYVMGTESLDTYDAFVSTLKSLNIDRCIELKQAALDRYNAR